jgi:UDP-GlcNAc:undecaprenyl-phosphate GlcNAc-1-phosphate transferase
VPPLGAYAAVAVVAALCTYLVLFPVRALATRVGFVAEPDERRIHARVTPLGGGAAMYLAFLVSMLLASLLHPLQGLFAGSSEPLGLVLGASVIFAVGLIDDYREMSAPAKMAGQVLAAMVLVFMGVTMFQFKIPFIGFLVLSPQVTPLLTALWVVVITNAVNLIDGLDGLAGGVVAIAAGALAIYGLRLVDLGILPADNIGPLIAVIAFGVCLGFLPHNFHPARAFMGDAGALFLGLLMAAATMVIGGRTPEYSGQSYFFFAPLFIPLFILGVPIADMAFAFVRRTARGQSFDTPDKDHLHHRLLRLGHGPRRTVIILWSWTALLSGLVLIPLFGGAGNAVIPFLLLACALALFTLFHPGLRKGAGAEDAGDRSTPVGDAGDRSAPAGDAGDRSAPARAAGAGVSALTRSSPSARLPRHGVGPGQVGAPAPRAAEVAVPGPARARPHPAPPPVPAPGARTPVRSAVLASASGPTRPERRMVARWKDGEDPDDAVTGPPADTGGGAGSPVRPPV